MLSFIRFADNLSGWFGKTFGWLILLMTFGVSYEVFVRYVLNSPTSWSLDVSFIMYGTLFMMAEPIPCRAAAMSGAISSIGSGLSGCRARWISSCTCCSFFPVSPP